MKEPLAQRLRPRTLDEVCGQRHLLAPGQVFRRTIDRGVIPNMIFYGPSGVGKTTVASIIAANSGMRLYKLNGTTASTSDIKSVLGDIGTLNAANGILLYLDEIQYFNKRQQQSLLECVEQGTVTLIASTTENPYFYVYNALLSRCTVFEFKSLTAEDIAEGVKHAAQRLGESDGTPVNIPVDALEYLAQSAGGDMRKALGNLEFAVNAAPVQDGTRLVTLEMVTQVAQRTAMRYDKEGDDHYDIVSAYQKSMRGSDPDAGSGGPAQRLPPVDGVRLRGCWPCLPADHPDRKSGCGCCQHAGPAGSAYSVGGRGNFGGDQPQIQHGRSRH